MVLQNGKSPSQAKSTDVRLSEPETDWVSSDSVNHSTCLGEKKEEVRMLYNVNMQKILYDR